MWSTWDCLVNPTQATSAYATSQQFISNLVNIVSKNSNLLLDIGPKGDDSIPTVMQQRLQDISAWLKINGESIYNTTYRWRGPQDGNQRFISSPNKAFSITDLVKPGSQIVTGKPIPIQPDAKSTMFGYHGALQWTQQNGTLIITVPTVAQQADKSA